jgi:hypothetical protein
MNDQPKGCLAFLFGYRAPAQSSGLNNHISDDHEGDVHSGPGGYEDGSYKGGYAADYYADDDEGDFRHEH